MTDLERLRDLLLARSVTRGDFTLSSGRKSTFYIDARRTTMSGEGMALIGSLGLERLAARGWVPRAVGGLTLGADPVRSEERRVGKSVDLGGRRIIKKKKIKNMKKRLKKNNHTDASRMTKQLMIHC